MLQFWKQLGSIDQYKIKEKIGEGVQGTVYRVKSPKDNSEYAIKVYKNVNAMKHEAQYLQKLKHKNIAEFYDSNENKVIEGQNQCQQVNYVKMELCSNVTLFDFINKCNGLSEASCLNIFKQILGAVEHCHSLGIGINDIKDDNILFQANFDKCPSNFEIKIIDFGLAKPLHEQLNLKIPEHWISQGQPFMCPKFWQNQSFTPEENDTFGLAILLFYMRACNWPFLKANGDDEMYKLFIQQEPDKFWEMHEEQSKELYEAAFGYSVESSSKDEANQKISYFSSEFKDLLNKLFEQKISIRAIKDHPWMQKQENSQEQIMMEIKHRKKLMKSGYQGICVTGGLLAICVLILI